MKVFLKISRKKFGQLEKKSYLCIRFPKNGYKKAQRYLIYFT